MDITVSIDEQSGTMAVDGQPVKDMREMLSMVMEKVQSVLQGSAGQDQMSAEDQADGGVDDAQEQQQPGPPDKAAMMQGFGG